jgi:hypothetical protein
MCIFQVHTQSARLFTKSLHFLSRVLSYVLLKTHFNRFSSTYCNFTP